MTNELEFRDIDEDVEKILEKRGFCIYDTEGVHDKKCPDCGRIGHCEC